MSFDRLAARPPPAERVRPGGGDRRLLGRDRRDPAHRSAGAGGRRGAAAAGRRTSSSSSARSGSIIFGVWLAIALDGIEVWNGWVIAAIMLWAVASERAGAPIPEFAPCLERAKELVAAGQTGPDAQLARAGADAERAVAPLDRHGGDAADPRRHDLEAGRLMLASIRPDSLEPAALRARPRCHDPRRRVARRRRSPCSSPAATRACCGSAR